MGTEGNEGNKEDAGKIFVSFVAFCECIAGGLTRRVAHEWTPIHTNRKRNHRDTEAQSGNQFRMATEGKEGNKEDTGKIFISFVAFCKCILHWRFAGSYA